MYTPEIQHIADEIMGRIPKGFWILFQVASISRGRTLLNFGGDTKSSRLKSRNIKIGGKKEDAL